MNTNTAITSQLLNQTDQITPYGTLKYDQTGSSTFTGADGKTYTVPKFQATQSLSPTEQALFDLARDQRQIDAVGRTSSARCKEAAASSERPAM